MSRRTFVTALGAGTVAVMGFDGRVSRVLAAPRDATLATARVPKFVTPLVVPPVMPRTGVLSGAIDYYEISVRQLRQQMLPPTLPSTTVWGYGAERALGTAGLHATPSATIEAQSNRPVRIKWVNGLVDRGGRYLPHLLTVDQTLHWANPPGGMAARDMRPTWTDTPQPYAGPVPISTHVHGAHHVGDESDGHPEAWFLPNATNIPTGYAERGTWYDFFAAKARTKFGVRWGRGFSVSQYPNLDRARTNWFHDHTLGMTRLNVYAGTAGFYLVRGGAGDELIDTRTGRPGSLPGPAPREGDPATGRWREIPLAIQDRAFRADGSLYYPDSRALFDGIAGPYIPHSDIPPQWNPEFFGNAMVVNGRTWPWLEVEQRRYRLRCLNACQSRFLILDFADIPGVRVWQVGNDGGFLTRPLDLTATRGSSLLLAPAERADLVVDFTRVPVGRHVLRNTGPDEPFGGGAPGEDFEPADPATTGRVLQFRVVAARGADTSPPPQYLRRPAVPPVPATTRTRQVALVELMATGQDEETNEVEGPSAGMLGVVVDGRPQELPWHEAVTETPAAGSAEVWELYNTTGDAHPIHLHEVAFEVVNRQPLRLEEDDVSLPLTPEGPVAPPEPGEAGQKDTVVAYPGQVTRIRAEFRTRGQYVWHCHILEHEDNEMMRPMRIGAPQPGEPGGM